MDLDVTHNIKICDFKHINEAIYEIEIGETIHDCRKFTGFVNNQKVRGLITKDNKKLHSITYEQSYR